MVTLVTFTLILLDLQGPVSDLFFQTIYTTLKGVDLLRRRFVLVKQHLILLCTLFSSRNVPVEGYFEFFVKIVDLLNEIMFHGLELLHVLVLGLLSEGLKVVLHLLELRVLLLIDGFDHVAQLLALHVVRVVNLMLLPVELSLDDRQVTLEFLV